MYVKCSVWHTKAAFQNFKNGKYFDQKTIIDYLLVLKMDGVFLAGHRGVKKRFSKFLSTTLDDKV